MPGDQKLLFLSNGHGEDSVAAKVISRLPPCPNLEISAWPMVGEGQAYRALGIATLGARNLLPGCGLSTLTWKYFWNDLRAGWIATHWRQYRQARRLRGRFDFAVAVGDIIPMAAAVLARLPFLLVGCGKSSYYGRVGSYSRLERRLLRKHCRIAFPRDRLTAEALARAGVPNRYVGNPMMDGLEASGEDFGIAPGTSVVTLLPGSRPDTPENLLELLAMAPAMAAGAGRRVHFLAAVCDQLDPLSLLPRLPQGWQEQAARPHAPARGIVLSLAHPCGSDFYIVKGRFPDAVRRADVVVGVAGTANEQAIGLGRPVVTFPTRGYLGRAYVQLKARYYGPAVLATERSGEAVAAAVRRILDDPALRDRMAAAGRERMGEPGASSAIAAEIVSILQALRGQR